MKKIIVILLLLAYGFSSFGMTLHVHFCCGKVDAVKLVPVSDDRCPVDKGEKKQGCCDDKQVEIKIKADYKNESSKQLKFKVPDSIIPHPGDRVEMRKDILPVFNRSIAPPGNSLLRLYKANCIYRI